MNQPLEVRIYGAKDGRRPFEEWFIALPDQQARQRILSRIDRVAAGNLGDHSSVGDGVLELRFLGKGPGWRVYFGRDGNCIVVLLCGGDKSTQSTDIARAKAFWADYLGRRES